MKKILLLAAVASVSACSTHHLPSTQINDLDEVRTAIQQAKDAGAEKCAPEFQAKAVATMYQAAHEITDEAGYHPEEDAELIQQALNYAKKAREAAKANCAKPKPAVVLKKPVVTIQPKPVVQVAPKIIAKKTVIQKKVKPVVLEVIHLKGIYFESNSDQLTPSSTASLKHVVETLNKRPDIRVEVAAYTDSRGKAAYNLALSKKRAQSTMKYLLDHGIEATRISAQGYGEVNPIADNTSAEGRAKNRRVELHVLK